MVLYILYYSCMINWVVKFIYLCKLQIIVKIFFIEILIIKRIIRFVYLVFVIKKFDQGYSFCMKYLYIVQVGSGNGRYGVYFFLFELV